MKSKLSLFASLLLMGLLFTSCQTDSKKEDTDITGIWSFITLQGQYAELWVNENSMLTLRMPRPRPAIFDYLQDADTIMLYTQGEAEAGNSPLDDFYIKSRTGKEVVKMQDGIETKLTLVETKAPKFEATEEFKEKVLSDFKKRASQK